MIDISTSLLRRYTGEKQGTREREKEGRGGGREGGEGTKVSHFSWHPRVFVLSIEPLCSTLRYPKSHVSMH